MSRFSLRSFLAAPAVSLFLFSRAWAIVIASGAANDSPPPSDPGFGNVGHLNGASGVYLGNQWALTVGHVGPGPISLQGVTYQPDASTAPVFLQNSPPFANVGKPADAVLFRLQSDPELPALQIANTQPVPGQTVLMVGNGLVSDGAGIHYYHYDSLSDAYSEQPAPAVRGINDSAGMAMVGTSSTRWGENILAQNGNDWSSTGKYFSLDFCTHFDHPPYNFPTGDPVLDQVLPNEAQAATGDSGGAAFVGGKLAGLIYAGTAPTSMPVVGNTAFFGDSTYMVRLASYRRQILNVTQLTGFQVPGDFNQNGTVDAGDVAAMGAALTDLTAYEISKQISDAELLTLGDFDHSGSVTNSDFQRLLDYISGASGSLTIVPEPAAWELAGTGALMLLLLGVFRRGPAISDADNH